MGKARSALTAALLSKENLSFTEEETEPMTVIYQTTEDDADDTVVPVLTLPVGTEKILSSSKKMKIFIFEITVLRSTERYHAKTFNSFDPMSSYIGERTVQ